VSNLSPFSRRGRIVPAIPHGDVLGTYETYLEAQSVVDRLSKADFEITGLAIVGNNLTSVETVTGKLNYGRTAITGAARGAWFGLFIGLMFFLLSPVPVIGYIAAAAFIGAGISMVFSVGLYTVSRRTRDFTSTNQVLARSYDIIVSPQSALRARTLLAQGGQQAGADHQRAAVAPAVLPAVSEAPANNEAPAAPAVPDAIAPVSAGAGSGAGAGAGAGVGSAEAAPVRAKAVHKPEYGEMAPVEPEASDDAPVELSAKAAAKPRAKRVAKPPVDPAAND